MNIFELVGTISMLGTESVLASLSTVESRMSSVGNGINTVQSSISNVGAELGQVGSRMAIFGNTIENIGETLTNAITQPLISLTEQGLKYSATIEDLQVAFGVLLGSETKAADMMGEIREIARTTPFETENLAEAAKTFLAYGMAQESVLPTLTKLGDVAMGNSEHFKVLTYNMAQISSAGKLQAIDLKSLILAGWNPLTTIMETTGETMEEVKARMKDGNISFAEVQQALDKVTSAGGRFYQGMEKGSQTLNGRLSTLKDTVNEVLANAVQPLFNYIRDFIIPTLTEWAMKFDAMPQSAKTTIAVILALVAAIGPLVIVLGTVVTGAGLFLLALSQLLNPINLIIVGVTTLVGLLGMGGLAGALLAIPNINMSGITNLFETIKTKASELIGYLKKEWEPAIKYLLSGDKGALSKIDDAGFKNALIDLRKTILDISEKIELFVKKINVKVKELDKDDVNDWSTTFINAINAAMKIVNSFIDVISEFVKAFNTIKKLKLEYEVFSGGSILAKKSEIIAKYSAEIELLKMDLQEKSNKKVEIQQKIEMATTVEGKEKAKEQLKKVNNEIDDLQYDISSKTKKFEKKFQIDVDTGESVSKAKAKGEEVGFGYKLGLDNTNPNVAQSFSELSNNVSKLNKSKEAGTLGNTTAANFANGINSQDGNVAANVTNIANNVKKLNKNKEANSTGNSLGSNFASGISSKGGEVTAASEHLAKFAKSPIGKASENASSWGANIGNAIASGLKSAANAVGEAAKSVASKISAYLGHSSPTKEGPGSLSDKWMPNLINQITTGLIDGSSDVGEAANIVARKISNNLAGINIATTNPGDYGNNNVTINIPMTVTKEADAEKVREIILKSLKGIGGFNYYG
jgi:tape measure domain-containing protein